ncbi:MAG: histidine triad protein [Rhodobiaceae bacterium]|nr:histidine triad protein [Rhodobiaceae bacterium]|tara:strand:+ start:1032 stop:1433 length:402 start_codon:yes stop_codon:yes gene_type:complete
MAFQLDDRLAADTVSVMQSGVVDIRMMRDARYYWLVLVPQIEGAVEWFDLPDVAARGLFTTAQECAQRLQALTRADKMNIAALGNMVKQLHVHVIARHEADEAWPGPVWGVGEAVDFDEAELKDRLIALRAIL